MSLFPDTIALALAGGKVEAANLVEFDFATDAVRLWQGTGILATNDGEAWFATGTLGDVKGIEQAINGEAPEATFTLSGIDPEVMRLARDEWPTEARGRMVRVYLQFFGVEDEDDPDNQRPLDLPYPVAGFRMLKPSFAWTEEGERSVQISAESIFSLRSRPRHAMYTDADQQRRFPGDKGFAFVGSLVNKVVTWPDY